MDSIIKKTVRTFALLVALCATGGAWAAKPKAVWWGDLSDASSRGGFTIDLNNGTATENLNTAVDGVVTIGSGSNGGVRFMRSTASGYQLSAIARINPGANPTLSSNPKLFSLRNTRSNSSDIIGVGFGSDGKIYATWDKSNNGAGSSSAVSFADAFTYTAARFWCASSSDATATHGTYGYWNKNQMVFNNACRNDAEAMYGVTIGGTYNRNNDNLNGAKIDYVVIFDDATGDVVTDITAFSVSEMTTAGTDLDTATSATGVNLPATATLTTASTPAAVFVQQTSTLTVTGSGSLNINSGNGPLYVADGTTLTVDATGITTLSAQNPSVTLVSGKIYGADLITVKVPVVSEGKAVASVTESGVTLTYSVNNVTFTSPFTGSVLAAPTTATAYGESATQISFGNKVAFQQTVNAKSAVVAMVDGGEFSTALNGFLTTGEVADNATMDVYLDVTGGSGLIVCGVQKCAWQTSPFTAATTGDAIVQIEGGTYQYVFGAGDQGAYNNSVATVTGNTGVTIKGSGKVSGSVFGGWSSSHNKTPSVSGNTAVRIENVQDVDTAGSLNYIGKGFVVGGSTFQANSSSPTSVGGNSSVSVALGNSASGSFAKKIVGGSLIPEITDTSVAGGAQAVTGNTSVSITAPSEVTFSQLIVGGGYNGHQGSRGSVTVGGNSSVTLSGGKYSGRIVAGSYARGGGTATVAGTATLTLNGGVFTGATLDGGNATGAKTLVIGDNLDISDATVTGFTAVTLGDGATAQMAVGEEGAATLGAGAVLKLVIGDDEVANGYTPSVSGSGTVEYYEYVESNLTKVTDAARLDGNNLNASAPIWSPAEADASGTLNTSARWSTGAVPADNAVVKISVNGNNTLTIDATRTYGHVYVIGSGTLSLEQSGENLLTAGSLEIASGVTVNISSGAPLKVQNGTVSGGEAINVASGASLTLDAVVCSSKLDVSGTLNTYNAVTLSNSNNIFQYNTGSVFNIESGTATVTCQSTGYNGLAGTINIKSGATLAPQVTDSLCYYRSGVAVNVWGTLALGSKRWTVADAAKHIITLYEGAMVTGAGDGNGALNWNITGGGKLVVDGNASLQAAVKILAGETWIVEVAEGKTLTMSSNGTTATSGAITKTGEGTLNNTAEIRNTGLFTVSEGEVVSTKVPAGNVSIANDAKFTIVDTGTSGSPTALNKFTGTGVLELKCNSAHTYYGGESAFAGKVIVNNVGSNGAHFHGASFTAQPQFEVLGSATLTEQYNNGELYVKNLTGSGDIKTNYGSVAFDGATPLDTPRTIKVLQNGETTFSGKFTYADNNNKHRNACLSVIGENETTHTLTLSGASTTYGELTIGAYAKVAFTSTGSWVNGSVAVAGNGVLESAKADAITKLALADGATIVFPTSSSTLTGITSLTFASGATYISFPNGAPDSETTIIDWTSVGSAPAGDFKLDGDVADTHVITKGDTGLTITKGVASVRTTSGVTHYTTVSAAVSAAYNAGEALQYITICSSSAVNVSYFAKEMKIKNYGGATITIRGTPGDVSLAEPVTVDGITTYTATDVPSSYTWTDVWQDNHNWTTIPNWNVTGGGNASRYPQAGDTVIFNDGATVTLDTSATVAGITVNGAVSISGEAVSLNTSGNIAGSGTLTLSDICLASVAAGITVAPNVNFTNDSELAGANALTLNGAVVISDTFKVWNSDHVINGNVTINSGVTFRYGALLLINGAATVKGAFTRDAGSSSYIKFCGVVTIENGNVSIDGWQSGNLDDAATVVLAGATATLTDSRGIQIALEKVTTSLYNRYVNKAGNIYSVVKPGTIFSVY